MPCDNYLLPQLVVPSGPSWASWQQIEKMQSVSGPHKPTLGDARRNGYNTTIPARRRHRVQSPRTKHAKLRALHALRIKDELVESIREDRELTREDRDVLDNFRTLLAKHSIILHELLRQESRTIKAMIKKNEHLLNDYVDEQMVALVLEDHLHTLIDESLCIDLFHARLPGVLSTHKFKSIMEAQFKSPKLDASVAHDFLSMLAGYQPNVYADYVLNNSTISLVKSMLEKDSNLFVEIVRSYEALPAAGKLTGGLARLPHTFKSDVISFLLRDEPKALVERTALSAPHETIAVLNDANPTVFVEHFTELAEQKLLEKAFAESPRHVALQVKSLLESKGGRIFEFHPELFETMKMTVEGEPETRNLKVFSDLRDNKEQLISFLRLDGASKNVGKVAADEELSVLLDILQAYVDIKTKDESENASISKDIAEVLSYAVTRIKAGAEGFKAELLKGELRTALAADATGLANLLAMLGLSRRTPRPSVNGEQVEETVVKARKASVAWVERMDADHTAPDDPEPPQEQQGALLVDPSTLIDDVQDPGTFVEPVTWKQCYSQEGIKLAEAHVALNRRQAKMTIYGAYLTKLTSDKQCKRDGLEMLSMDTMVVSDLYVKHGKQDKTATRLKLFSNALKQHGHDSNDDADPFVLTFARMCGCSTNPYDLSVLNSYLATIKRLIKIAHSPKDTEQTKARDDPKFDLPRVELKRAKKLMASLTRNVDGREHDSCVMLDSAAFDGVIPPAIETKCVTVDVFLSIFLEICMGSIIQQRTAASTMFDELDKNHDGELSFEEFLDITARFAAFKMLPAHTLRHLFCSQLGNSEQGGGGGLCRRPFLDLCRSQLQRHISNHVKNAAEEKGEFTLPLTRNIKKLFDQHDINGNLVLCETELKALLVDLGENPNTADLKLRLKLLDIDADGGVDFNEFVSYFRDEKVKQLFETRDVDNTGEITVHSSAESLLADMGVDTEPPSIKALCLAHPLGKSSTITFGEFFAWWQRFDVHSVFWAYDQDKSDTLGLVELKSCCEDLGIQLSEEEVHRQFAKVDGDESGALSFTEFYVWWKQHHEQLMHQKRAKRLSSSAKDGESLAKDDLYRQAAEQKRAAERKAEQDQYKLLAKVANEYELDLTEVLDKFAPKGDPAA